MKLLAVIFVLVAASLSEAWLPGQFNELVTLFAPNQKETENYHWDMCNFDNLFISSTSPYNIQTLPYSMVK